MAASGSRVEIVFIASAFVGVIVLFAANQHASADVMGGTSLLHHTSLMKVVMHKLFSTDWAGWQGRCVRPQRTMSLGVLSLVHRRNAR
eukprot:5439354-Ditylum_brightwellii.AAC.1